MPPTSAGGPTPPGYVPPRPAPPAPPSQGSPHEVYQGPPGVGVPQPPKKSSGIGWIFGCLGCAFLGAICVALGLFGITYFGFGVLAEQVGESVSDNPVVLEHLGGIQSIKLDWMASMADPDPDLFVYQIEGSKGSGEIRVHSTSSDDGMSEHVTWGVLRTSDGSTYDLFP